MQIIEQIVLPFPLSVNAAYRAVKGRSILSERMRDWKNEAGLMLNCQRFHRFTGPVEIEISLTPPDRRKRDIDNLFKCVLDLLKTHKVIVDDSSEYVRKLSAEWQEGGDPCHVLIRSAA